MPRRMVAIVFRVSWVVSANLPMRSYFTTERAELGGKAPNATVTHGEAARAEGRSHLKDSGQIRDMFELQDQYGHHTYQEHRQRNAQE